VESLNHTELVKSAEDLSKVPPPLCSDHYSMPNTH